MNTPPVSKKKTKEQKTRYMRLLIAILTIGFLSRFFFIPNPGFEADVSFWKSWGLAPLDHGVVWSMRNTNNNYPTPFAYVLQALAWIYSLFADPHNYREFWQNTNLLFLTIVKLPAIISDFLIFGIFLLIGKHAKRLGFPTLTPTSYLLLGAMYLLNPITIMDSAWWGQVDSFGVLLFLFALLSLLYKKPFLAGLIFITAMMMKLQNMIYGPLFFAFIWQMTGFGGLMRALAGVFIGFFGLNIEFLLAKDMNRVMQSLVENYDYFPLMSLNAYNPWWIVAGGKGMEVSDKLLVLGIMNAKKVGLTLFASMYLFAVLNLTSSTFHAMWRRSSSWMKKKSLQAKRVASEFNKKSTEAENPLLFTFFVSLSIVVFAFFLFQTESHDRYAFPLTAFLLMIAPFLSKTRRFWWIIGYITWTILYFYNFHSALAGFYPQNAIPALTALLTTPLTIAVSILLTWMFITFIIFLWKDISKPALFLALGMIITLLTLGNMKYILGKPIYLSDLTPYSRTQDWGRSVEDLTSSSGRSPRDWHRLSVQYFFYKKGIGTHANSRIAYDLNKLFTKLTTDYGVDTQGGPQGDVTFEVWGDGRLLWESETISRYERPRHTEVDITGVDSLEIITTDAGDGTTDDHADWLNTKLWR